MAKSGGCMATATIIVLNPVPEAATSTAILYANATRRGIVVIQGVVYNHYAHDAERAESQYDSTTPEQDIYYWYVGRSSDYKNPDGGYLDNGSTERTPRFWEEIVRQQFINAAAFLIEEMHVDGLRVDLTQAIDRQRQYGRRQIASLETSRIRRQRAAGYGPVFWRSLR